MYTDQQQYRTCYYSEEDSAKLVIAKQEYNDWLYSQDPYWFNTITTVEARMQFLTERATKLGNFLSRIDTASFSANRAKYDNFFCNDPWYLNTVQTYEEHLKLEEDKSLHPEKYKSRRRMEVIWG